MNTRPFNGTGRNVSEIGLGCWQIGGNWGEVSDDTALQILRSAHDRGVTFFDTADVYGDGRSERLVGQFLKEQMPGNPFVATKLGRRGDPGDPATVSYEQLSAYTDRSLKNLGVERIDLTQLHCVGTGLLRDGACFDALRRLKADGKIAAFGASVESMEEAELCMEHDDLASLQIIFNAFRQKPINAIFERAKVKNVAIVVRLPLASGLLAGKMSKETTFGESDHRHFNRDGDAFNVGETFAGLPFETGVDAAEAMRPVFADATGPDVTMAQAALRWVLDHDAVTTVIAGASRPQQAIDNAAVSDLPPLSSEAHAKLRAIYEADVREHIRGPY